MTYVVSRFNHHLGWITDYTSDIILYDRSVVPLPNAILVPNIGSDIYDKLSFIIDNYDNLPDVAVYIKANLFDYIRPKEFELIKNNTTFTPILSQFHSDTMLDLEANRQRLIPELDQLEDLNLKNFYYQINMIDPTKKGEVKKFSFYDEQGMYNELNLPAYLSTHHPKSLEVVPELMQLLGIWNQEYVQFAPGSNYILPKENILKHSKEFYKKLRSYIDWGVYPGECMIIERGLYNIWK